MHKRICLSIVLIFCLCSEFFINLAIDTCVADSFDINSIYGVNMFEKYYLNECLILPESEATLIINPSHKFQRIDGFGASLTDSSAWLFYNSLSSTQRDNALKDLFDPIDGIGLSYLRQPMGASDFRLAEYTYDDMPKDQADFDLSEFSIKYEEAYIIPILQDILAISPDIKIMASPWSPPAWMKTSQQIGKGSLRDDCYNVYADYFVKFIHEYSVHGISIDAITLQNEPHFEPGAYGGMWMSEQNQIDLVKTLGPKFNAADIDTKIIVWDHNWDNPDFPVRVLNDPEAKAYIDGVAWHHYGGNVSAQTTVHNAHPDKATYFTEGSDGTWNDAGFEADLLSNGRFIVDVIRNWAKVVVKWNLALDENNGPKIAGGCDTCYGVITIDKTSGQVSKRPHYYALAQVSKFVRPDAFRIDSTKDIIKGIKNVAFINPDNSIVLLLVNSGSDTHLIDTKINSKKFPIIVPSKSIMTLKWNIPASKTAQVWITKGNKSKLIQQQPLIKPHHQ